MRLLSLLSLLAVAAGAVTADYPVGAKAFSKVIRAAKPLRILVSNDDSWASANVRATYYALQSAGHHVLLVGPSQQQSGTGGLVNLPSSKTLNAPGRGNSIPAGSPYFGRNESDAGLQYFNGTPAACVLWALDNVVPTFFDGRGVDLTVTGPNEGTNLGSFLYTLSGTLGASYNSVGRGIPSLAFSASTTIRDYKTLDFENVDDESIRIGTYASNIVTHLGDLRKHRRPVLPLGLGANVNFAKNTGLNEKCPKSNFYHTRLTGGALTDKIVVNATTGLPVYQDLLGQGLNVCLSGDCSLPGETNVIKKDLCSTTISIYSVDYDAPTLSLKHVKPHVKSVVARLNGKKAFRGQW